MSSFAVETQGLAAGLLVSFVGWSVVRRTLPAVRSMTHPKYQMLVVLIGGSLGSFIGATTAGKNEAHMVEDVFRVSFVHKLCRAAVTSRMDAQLIVSSIVCRDEY
eukprot:21616-Eustigmatos_ZCMA.PRE.1